MSDNQENVTETTETINLEDIVAKLTAENEKLANDFNDIKAKQQGSDRASQRYKAELDDVKVKYSATLSDEEIKSLELKTLNEQIEGLKTGLKNETEKRQSQELENYKSSKIINSKLDSSFSLLITGKTVEDIDLQIEQALKIQEINRQTTVVNNFSQSAPNNGTATGTMTNEKFRAMGIMERQAFKNEKPEEYKILTGA